MRCRYPHVPRAYVRARLLQGHLIQLLDCVAVLKFKGMGRQLHTHWFEAYCANETFSSLCLAQAERLLMRSAITFPMDGRAC